jgi:hypothetical protein
MTDRHAGYVVVLERDIREDDAEVILSAIGMVKGVLGKVQKPPGWKPPDIEGVLTAQGWREP